MATFLKNKIMCNKTTACIILCAIAPFALCALGGLCSSHRNCPLMIVYWIITISGVLAARQVRTLARCYALTISHNYILYKEPFRTKLIKITELLSIYINSDDTLVLKTLHTRLVVPLSIFTSNDEFSKTRAMLQRFAPSSCHINVGHIAGGTN